MPGISLQKPFEYCDPLFCAAGADVDLCERDVGFLVLGCPLQYTFEKADGRVRLSASRQHERQVVRRFSIVRPSAQRIAEVMLGAIQVSCAAKEHPQIVEGFGEIGL